MGAADALREGSPLSVDGPSGDGPVTVPRPSIRAFLRRNGLIILTVMLLTPAVAFLSSIRQTERFEASALVLVSHRDLGSALTDLDGVSSIRDPAQLARNEVTFAESPPVVSSAAAELRIPGFSADDLRASSDVDASEGVDLLTFSVEAEDATFAAAAANAYASAYISYRSDVEERAIAEAQFQIRRRLQALRDSGTASFRLNEALIEQDDDLEAFRLLRTPRASLVADATQQVRRSSPRPRRDVLTGLGFGAVLALSLTWLREARNRTVRSGEAAAQMLDTSVLGHLPPVQQLVVHDASGSRLGALRGPLDESLVHLRESTRFALRDNDARVVLLTAATPYENRSVVVASLAVALARSGDRVALVDADPAATPSLVTLLGVPPAPTLGDVISGRASLRRALTAVALSPDDAMRERPGSAPGELSVLSARSGDMHPADVFTPAAVAERVSQLRHDYDVVFVNAPPMNTGSLSLSLGATADALIVIARLHVVRSSELEVLRSRLVHSPALRIGVIATGGHVMSGSPGRRRAGRHGYGSLETTR